MSDQNALDSDHHIAHARRLLKDAGMQDAPDAQRLTDAQGATAHAILALAATVRDVVEAIDRATVATVRANDRP